MEINFSEQELNWLNNYAGNHGLSLPAAVRQALRVFSLVEATPGALDWLTNQTRDQLDQLGPKYQPMPALETVPAPEESFVKTFERSPRRVQETPVECGECDTKEHCKRPYGICVRATANRESAP